MTDADTVMSEPFGARLSLWYDIRMCVAVTLEVMF